MSESKAENVIVVGLSYDKSLVLPFDEQGLAIAKFLQDAPIHGSSMQYHYGGDVTFEPYTGEPISVDVVKMVVDPTQAYVESSRRVTELSSQVSKLERESAEALKAKDEENAKLRREMDSVLGALRDLKPFEDTVQRGDSESTKTRKRRATIAQANEAVAKLRALGGATDEEEAS